MSKKQYSVRTAAVAATERRARRSGVAVAASGSGSSYNELYGDIAGKLDKEAFDSMFERVSDGVDADGVERWYIRAKASLVSVGELTAYGLNGSAGDGAGPGAGVTELRCLDDVILTDPKAGQILKYDGSHWVNAAINTGLDEAALAAYLTTNHYAKTSDIPSLVGFATQTWVEGKSYATEAWVNAKGYLTQHQDISHLLTREEFEAMFERVDMDNGQWYILAKSHLASVGDITAYGTGGPGSTLGSIGDVTLGSLAAGDVIMWDGQKWINSQIPTGGLDESQLAAYLTANNYITQADLGDYVTVDGEQTISGKKTFGAGLAIATQAAISFANPSAISFDIYGNLYRNSQAATNWSIYDTDTTSKILDVDMRTGDLLITGNFIKSGGTASQFLKADGSVDSRSFLLNCGTLSGNIDSDYGEGIVTFDPIPSGTPPCGSPNITLLSMGQWGRRKMLAFPWDTDEIYLRRHNDSAMLGWTRLLSTHNYWEILNNAYLKIDGANATHAGTSAIARSLPEATGNVLDTTLFVTSDNNPAGNNNYNYYRRPATKIWNYILAKDGSGSGLDADLLDNCHNGDVTAKVLRINNAGGESACFQFMQQASGWKAWESPDQNWRHVIKLNHGNGDTYCNRTLAFDFFNHRIYTGKMLGGNFDGWKTIAFLDDNVASASKLQTARTIYINSYNGYRAGDGVTFDGTGDITLKLPNSITASDWFRSYGASGWYNETYGGGIYMEDTTWVRTWQHKAFYTGGGQIRTDNSFQRGGYAGNSWNNGYGALNVDIYDNANQTPLLVAVRQGAACDTTGANRLFAMELLNSGTQLNFGFGGAAKFYFYSGGTFVATGDVTAYSDARLKSDIRPLTNRGFIAPRTYIKDGKRSIGFLAQEVQQLYPELVMDTGGADHWLSLNYGNLVAVLEAQIIDHEDRIKRLEERA